MIKENLITHPEIHPKGWGKENWIVNSKLYCGKIMEVKKGKKCSIHYHKLKDETFYILSGLINLNLYINGYSNKPHVIIMKPNDTIHIPQGLIHQFIGLKNSKILEISTQHFEEDSHRIMKGD
ncbi:MAG: cupin domain-containing protein [Candidatus Nanoarchaeia archaeon]|jgi:mannose-6-phosphate isomerase-like protein (cupin superfamily)|nr:cupin domain-containing protein [Candidatus Nanoarchaeia archaeon]MDD3994034.1 cupin domain-containing protein [Candidatus Nanoarchaeia archaeon]MDD4563572.1 cupin domain-containing protein [Candidatus Nanoarchaeia archaeon]